MGKSAINPAVVGKHSTDIAALKNDLGIVEDGDTATHTIAQGQYVIWQGALYTADAAIASGTTLAASGGNKNLTAVENGGLNALNSKVTPVNTILKDTNNTTICTMTEIGNFTIFSFDNDGGVVPSTGYNVGKTFAKPVQGACAYYNDSSTVNGMLRLTAEGKLYVHPVGSNTTVKGSWIQGQVVSYKIP